MRDHVGSFFGVVENFLLHKKALHVDDVHPREDRAEQMELWQVLTLNRNKKKKFVFPESWKNIRSCNKELHENCIKRYLRIFMSENWLFCWHPLYYVEEKSKKETAMWKGSKTIQDVIRRSRTLFWTLFLAFCGSFKEKQYTAMSFLHCPAVREKVSKRRRKGELKISTARFDLFWIRK